MAENKSPAFQFYYKEWLTGTMSMTRQERDIYLMLIIASYDLDGLPNDMEEVYRIALCRTTSEKKSADYIIEKKFFIDSEGKYRNNRLEKVRSNQISFKESKSKAGKKGAVNRWQKDGTAMPLPLANDSSTSTTTSTTTIVHQQQQHAHDIFCKKLFTEEWKLDKENLELQLKNRREISENDVLEFNRHLLTEGKHHVHITEYLRHLRNWLNTRPVAAQTKVVKLKAETDISSEDSYDKSKSVV